jgi:hypothetical protein
VGRPVPSVAIRRATDGVQTTGFTTFKSCAKETLRYLFVIVLSPTILLSAKTETMLVVNRRYGEPIAIDLPPIR